MKSGAGRGATGRMEQEKRQKMLAEYCKTRDVGLRNELVTEYMYLADMVARKYAGRGVEYDDLKQIAAMFPERKAVGVSTKEVVYGGGNIHCITQQQPAPVVNR